MSSITLIGVVKLPYTGGGNTLYRREYSGLKEDFDKLPTDDDLASGSICRFPNTGEYAEYFAGTKTWYLHKGSSGSGGSFTPGDAETATDEEVADMFEEVFDNSGESGEIPSSPESGSSEGDKETASDKEVDEMFNGVFSEP